MKKLKYFILLAISVFTFSSCEKDEDRVVVYEDSVAPAVVSAPVNGVQLVLNRATKDALVTFNWTTVDYGISAIVTYTVEAHYNNKAVVLASVNDMNTVSVATDFMNRKLLSIDVVGGTTVDVDFYVVASLGANGVRRFSDAINATVKTYTAEVSYEWIYLVGNFQGWNATTPTDSIKSEADLHKYEGYIYFGDANTSIEGKFNQKKSWADTFCWGAGSGAGTISNDPSAGNLVFLNPSLAGTYKITADLTAKTYSIALYEIGIIGDATPTGWSSDTKLKYNNVKDVWELSSIALIGDSKIKFRLNSDWAVAWGGSLTDLSTSGGDITIATSGTYSVVVDLKSDPMTCKLTEIVAN